MSYRPAHNRGMRVLVVEDHAKLAERIAQGLRQAGMAVDAVHDGAAALEAAAEAAYDVIVLDRDLPVVHGDRVCRARSTARSPRRSTGGADGPRRDSARTRATSSANANGLGR